MLTKLELKNFKCFEQAEISFKPLTVLVGPNNSGKSSVLEAIQTAALYAQGVAPSGYFGPWWTLGALVRHGTKPESFQARLCADPVSGSKAIECVMKHGGAGQFVDQAVCQWFWGIRRYKFDPAVLRAGTPDGAPRTHLGPQGEGLASTLYYLVGKHRRQHFEPLEQALIRDIPGVEGLDVGKTTVFVPSRDGAGVIRGYSGANGENFSFRERGSSEPLVPAHASDGLLLVLAFLTLAHNPEAGTVLLIEEPENGIHPRNLQRVMDVLRGLTEGRFGAAPIQVILTTHSPYLLDMVKPEEVRVFRRDDKGVATVFPLDQVPKLHERLEDYTVGELWYNVGEDGLAGAGS